jgi:hypothetical protein
VGIAAKFVTPMVSSQKRHKLPNHDVTPNLYPAASSPDIGPSANHCVVADNEFPRHRRVLRSVQDDKFSYDETFLVSDILPRTPARFLSSLARMQPAPKASNYPPPQHRLGYN